MIHIADHRLDPSWSTRFYMWGTRAHHYLASPLTLIVASIGGATGLILSIAAGTTLTWATAAGIIALLVFAVLLRRGKARSIRPHQWGVLLLGVFFNQVFLAAPAVYLTARLRWAAARRSVPGRPGHRRGDSGRICAPGHRDDRLVLHRPRDRAPGDHAVRAR